MRENNNRVSQSTNESAVRPRLVGLRGTFPLPGPINRTVSIVANVDRLLRTVIIISSPSSDSSHTSDSSSSKTPLDDCYIYILRDAGFVRCPASERSPSGRKADRCPTEDICQGTYCI
jgi:hypothetical protein